MKRKFFRSAADGLRLIAAAVLLAAAAGCAKAPPKILVYDTVFVDRMASGTGEKFTEASDYALARTVSETLRKAIADQKTFEVVPTPPEASADTSAGSEDQGPIINCAECILELAKKNGAGFVLTSAVTRFSGAAVYFKMELDDVANAKAVTVISTQISGFNKKLLRQAALDGLKQIARDRAKAG